MKKIKPARILLHSLLALVIAAGIGTMAMPIGQARAQEEVHDHTEDAHPAGDVHPEPEHEDHGKSDPHAGESENEHDEEVVRLEADQLKEFDIELATAKAGSLERHIELPGEIVLNADRLAHVVPRVSGIVREVDKTVGDRVGNDEILAVLESRDLAGAKAAYLAAVEREKLALTNFNREERLWKQKVTSEQEYLDARQALAETRIEKNSAEQQLHALGFSDDYLENLPKHPDATYTRFEIRAPFAGTIIEKHLTLGEKVSDAAEAFTIADLSTVWVDIDVYQKDLAAIRKGQSVTVDIGHGISPVTGAIGWVSPLVDEATRTARARVVVANPDDTLRPGLFITARIAVGNNAAGILVPKTALQSFEERTVVFVRNEEGFIPQPVTTGKENAEKVEILSGLEAGQTYVSRGAFTLKAQLLKGAFGDGHNH